MNILGIPCSILTSSTHSWNLVKVNDLWYAIDDGKMHLSDKDKAAITTNLWGSPLLDAGIYLKTVKIDSNVDTKIDYEIEYYPDGGTVIRSDEDSSLDLPL